MKYRIRYDDPYNIWIFLTPFALLTLLFMLMGMNNKWVIESKNHWWNRWKVVDEFDDVVDAHIKYFKLAHNLKINKYVKFPHNHKKGIEVTCKLTFQHNEHPIDPAYTYTVGYKPHNYARFYHACYSAESYEHALMKLWGDMEVERLISEKKEMN